MEASKLAAFRQKLEADAAAAAAKGAAPTMMPINDQRDAVKKWKKSATVRVGMGSPTPNGSTDYTSPGEQQGRPKIDKSVFRRSTSSPIGSLTSKQKLAADADAKTPTAMQRRSLRRGSTTDMPKLPAGPALAIPSTPSEARKKLGSGGTGSPDSKPRLSIPTMSPIRTSGRRPSLTSAKPSEVKAAMQKEKQIARAPRRRLKASHLEGAAPPETPESYSATRRSRSKSRERTARSKSPGLRPARSKSPGLRPSRSKSPGLRPSRSQDKDEDDELMAIVDEADRHKTKRQNVLDQMSSLSSHEKKPQERTGKKAAPMRRMSSNRKLMGNTPSNRIPEMRRRAAPQDLSMFAGETKVVEEEDVVKTAASADSSGSAGKKPKDGATKKAKTDAESHHEKLQKETVAKMKQEQEAKLNEAKEAFQKGHDLCWKENKPLYALGKYRIALFIRESTLGKYHEDTGRTYYWIGRSLIKLRDFEEALVALARALRIFERTLFSKHKYNKWASGAIDICFDEMGVDKASSEDYKEHLNASIQHERNGDRLRKLGKNTEAIAEYRNGIDTIEEYNPDAADLYCKIALILRNEDEFDRALEEYTKASQIYQLSLGADHPDTVNTLNQLIEKKRMNQLSLALQEKLDLKKKT